MHNTINSEDIVYSLWKHKVLRDIDKLYLIRKDFVMKRSVSESSLNLESLAKEFPELTSSELAKKADGIVFRKIYDEHPEIENALINIRGNKTNTPLYKFWDEMLEKNLSWQDDPAYNRDILFESAAKELNMWSDEAVKEELIEYDYTKSVSQNSRVARNNLIFELMRKRLMDKETLRDRLTPGGFDNARNAAEYLKNLLRVNENQDANDPGTLLFYNQLNQVAAKLIGIFANQNTNHQLSSLVRKLDLVSPILFDGMIGAKLLKSAEDLTGINSEGKIGTTLLAKEIQLADGRIVDVDLNLAEFLAASVDAVKDPVLNYLNFNTITASSGALLARMGYSTKDIGILFNQPIIKYVCDIMQNSGGLKQFSTARIEALKLFNNGNALPSNNISELTNAQMVSSIHRWQEAISTAEDIEKTVGLLKPDAAFIETQLKVLKVFEQAYVSSTELNRFINTTKFTAANAVGSTMGFFYNQAAVVDNYLNSEESNLVMEIYESLVGQRKMVDKSLNPNIPNDLINSVDGYITSQVGNPFAFEQCMYDLNKALLRVLEKYYPYNKSIYSQRRSVLTDFLPKGNVLDAETNDNIHRETLQHLLSISDSVFNPNGDFEGNIDRGTEYTNREYYLYAFPIEVFKLMASGKLNPIIAQYLGFSYVDTEDKSSGTSVKQLSISVNLSVEQADKNTFTDAWAQLALGDKASQDIAKGLFLHNYYKTGFGVGPSSFMQFAPVEVKRLLDVEGKSYLDFIGMDNLDNITIAAGNRISRIILEFAYMYALNHPDNYKLVHNISSKEKSLYPIFVDEKKGVKQSIVLNLKDLAGDKNYKFNPLSNFINDIDVESGIIKVHPVISYTTKVGGKFYTYHYVAKVNGDLGFRTTGTIEYEQVPVLGKKNVSSIYASTLGEAVTILRDSTQKLKTIEDTLTAEEKETINNQTTNEETQQQESEELLNGQPEESLFEDNNSNEEEFGSTSAEDIAFMEADIEKIGEKLRQCNMIDEHFLINKLLDAMEEKSEGAIDREFVGNEISKSLDEAGLSTEQRKSELIDNLVFGIKSNIKSGKRKVYTNLTKEQIC